MQYLAAITVLLALEWDGNALHLCAGPVAFPDLGNAWSEEEASVAV
ncbi:hypothetical protein [Streptomyces sp. NPDC056938]